MDLKKTTAEIFDQLIHLSELLGSEDYGNPSEVLFNNSIGRHYRHILEFYEMFLSGYESGTVNYDLRSHNSKAETNKEFAASQFRRLLEEINTIDETRKLYLQARYSPEQSEANIIETTAGRELIYNIEHAIHHMAMIKTAVMQLVPCVNLPFNFGVAYSTMRYREAECAQ